MKGGSDLQRYVDLLVPGAGPTKIRITRGEGPIDLVGSHCVEYFGFKDEDSDHSVSPSTWSAATDSDHCVSVIVTSEEEGNTDNEMEAEDQEESAKGNKSGDKKDEKTKEFMQLRDSKPTRQVVRVPTQKWETESQDVINSIVNPKIVKARADLHEELTKQGSKTMNLKLSVMPKRKKPALDAFKTCQSSQIERKVEETLAEESHLRWDKAPSTPKELSPSKEKLRTSILSCLSQLEGTDQKNAEEKEVEKELDKMEIEDEPPKPKKIIDLNEYRNRIGKISVEFKSNAGENLEDLSATSSSKTETENSSVSELCESGEDKDEDEVTVVSDRDDSSSVVTSVVINGGQKDGSDVDDGKEEQEPDVTTISDNENDEFEDNDINTLPEDRTEKPGAATISVNGNDMERTEDRDITTLSDDGDEEFGEKHGPDVTTVSDNEDDGNGNVEEREVTTLSGDDNSEVSCRHAPDVTVYSDPEADTEEYVTTLSDNDQDRSPGSEASVSIQSEVMMKSSAGNRLTDDPFSFYGDKSKNPDSSPTSTRNSTPEIPLETNLSCRSESPFPEVVQITKSIPEDAELKITLTKSPSKPSPVVQVDDDEDWEEIPSSPIIKSQLRLRNHRKFPSKLKVPDTGHISIAEDSCSIASSRPRRQKPQFPSLTDVDKAKLKNLPHEEREKAFNNLKREEEKDKSIDLTSDEEKSCKGKKMIIVHLSIHIL